MDLSEQLDDAIGHGPVPPPVSGTVAAGRRALLRRRLATTASALAVVVVVAVTGALVVPGTPAADVAPDPAAPPAPDPSTAPRPGSVAPSTGQGEVVDRMSRVGIERWRPGREPARGVRLTADGRLVAADGATILEQVTNPLDREPPAYSAAASVRRGGSTDWYLLDRSPRQGSVSSWGPWGAYASFSDWVDAEVRLARPGGEGAG